MVHLRVGAFLGLTVLIAASNASASTIVYQQLPGASSSFEDISSTRDFFGELPGFTTADDFTLTTTAIISDVHWWGEPGPFGGGTDFRFTFYADGAGMPGAILQTTNGTLSTTSVNVGSGSFDPVNFYSSDLVTPFIATAGTKYWISVFNQASDASWVWLAANAAGNGGRQGTNPGPPWSIITPDMAFQLTATDTVPEPATLLLVSSAVGVAGFGRLRRKLAARRSASNR